MKAKELSIAFDAFELMPVTINTTLEVASDEGVGVMSYRGILIDKDDFMVYLGYNEEVITTAISWDNIVTIELFDVDEERNAMEPGSGSKN
jgi:hypothetical protein